jgi:2-oxoglutarate ferredoxin oxidoreductase subunit alpha
MVPKPILDAPAGATIGIIAFGSSDAAVGEARDQMKEEANLTTAYLRLRAYPFTPEVEAFIRQYDRIYVVEQNRDAQMLGLLRLDMDPALAVKIRSVRHYNGLPIDARSVSDGILSQERS